MGSNQQGNGRNKKTIRIKEGGSLEKYDKNATGGRHLEEKFIERGNKTKLQKYCQ